MNIITPITPTPTSTPITPTPTTCDIPKKSPLNVLPKDVLNIMCSFCTWKELLAFSNTEKEAAQKMLHIWVSNLERANLFFFTTMREDRKVVHLNHFTGMVAIDYQYPDGLPFNRYPNAMQYHSQNQIAYNRNVITNYSNQYIQAAQSARIIRNLWMQHKTSCQIAPFNPPLEEINDLVGTVFVQKIMNAIKYKHHDLLYFLEIIRARSLTTNGCEEVVHFFKNIRHPLVSIRSMDPNECAIERYKNIHAVLSNFLLSYAAMCANVVAMRILLVGCRDINAPVIIAPESYPSSHLLSVFSTANNPSDMQYRQITPLLCAIAEGHLPIVHILLNAKADTNMLAKYWDGVNTTTPLGLAIHTGHTKITELLLHAKANPILPGGALHDPLFSALEGTNPDSPLTMVLKNQHRNPCPLQTTLVNLLIQHVPNLNYCDPHCGLRSLSDDADETTETSEASERSDSSVEEAEEGDEGNISDDDDDDNNASLPPSAKKMKI